MRHRVQTPRSTDAVARAHRNVVGWGVIGAIVGSICGLIFGLAFMTPGHFGFWMSIIAPTIFAGAVSAFTAGIASLDSPPPGDEPADGGRSSDRAR